MPGKARHFSGYNANQPGSLLEHCPCCKNQMFPAVNLDFSDPKLAQLGIWPQRYLNLLFCPFCGFYMKPYWIKYRQDGVELIGGDCSSREVLQQIETPYSMRGISLRELNADESPSIDDVRIEYRKRIREEGVYHQVGGEAIRGQNTNFLCPECNQPMRFSGILDYDDLNIPLYENGHRPVALIVGDGDCMNWHTCFKCLVIGLQWIH
ncbi:hypothetical protein GC207_03025 [bacterium]|nr:hypothetical protein [bacterium]